jgi:uncharacterized protein
MKIKISNLANGKYDYLFEGEISKIDIGEPYKGEFRTEVVLSKFDNQIILDSKTNINAELTCDRCNTIYNSVITSNYRMVYLLQKIDVEEEGDSGEIKFIHPDTDKIDIKNDVRDYAVLAVPMKRLCKEDCKGLCYKCGKNLNEGPCNCEKKEIDPRWEPLLEMKNKDKQN